MNGQPQQQEENPPQDNNPLRLLEVVVQGYLVEEEEDNDEEEDEEGDEETVVVTQQRVIRSLNPNNPKLYPTWEMIKSNIIVKARRRSDDDGYDVEPPPNLNNPNVLYIEPLNLNLPNLIRDGALNYIRTLRDNDNYNDENNDTDNDDREMNVFDSQLFITLAEEFHNDSEILLELQSIVDDEEFCVDYASIQLLDSVEYMTAIIKELDLPYIAADHASIRLRDITEFILALVEKDGDLFELASFRLKQDPIVVLEALKLDSDSFEHASPNLKADRYFMKQAIDVHDDWVLLEYAHPTLHDDMDLVEYAVSKSPFAFRHASTRLQDDTEYVLHLHELYGSDGHIIKYASERIKSDPLIALRAVKKHGKSLRFFSSEIQSNMDIVVNSELNILNLPPSEHLLRLKVKVNTTIEAVKKSRLPTIPLSLFPYLLGRAAGGGGRAGEGTSTTSSSSKTTTTTSNNNNSSSNNENNDNIENSENQNSHHPHYPLIIYYLLKNRHQLIPPSPTPPPPLPLPLLQPTQPSSPSRCCRRRQQNSSTTCCCSSCNKECDAGGKYNNDIDFNDDDDEFPCIYYDNNDIDFNDDDDIVSYDKNNKCCATTETKKRKRSSSSSSCCGGASFCDDDDHCCCYCCYDKNHDHNRHGCNSNNNHRVVGPPSANTTTSSFVTPFKNDDRDTTDTTTKVCGFSEDEVNALIEGIYKYEFGNWCLIRTMMGNSLKRFNAFEIKTKSHQLRDMGKINLDNNPYWPSSSSNNNKRRRRTTTTSTTSSSSTSSSSGNVAIAADPVVARSDGKKKRRHDSFTKDEVAAIIHGTCNFGFGKWELIRMLEKKLSHWSVNDIKDMAYQLRDEGEIIVRKNRCYSKNYI